MTTKITPLDEIEVRAKNMHEKLARPKAEAEGAAFNWSWDSAGEEYKNFVRRCVRQEMGIGHA